MKHVNEEYVVLASQSPRRQELLRSIGVRFHTCPANIDEHLVDLHTPHQLVEELAKQKASHVAKAIQAGSIQLPEKDRWNNESLAIGDEIQYGQNYLVIGSDTIVVCDEMILGKPQDKDEAVSMLQRLAGREHQVFTGLALIRFPEAGFGPYGASGEPMEKAGAYGPTIHLGHTGQYRVVAKSSDGQQEIIVGHTASKVTFRPMSDEEIRAYVKTGIPLDKAGSYGIQDLGAVFIEKIEGDYYSIMGLPLNLLYQMFIQLGISLFK